jgi:hypothetical protein
MDEKRKTFLDRYEVKILNDEKPCLRRSRRYDFFTDPKNASYIKEQSKETEVDKLVTLQIPEYYLNRLIEVENKFFAGETNNDVVRRMFDTFIEKEFEEAALRNNSEAIRKAYENYSMLLHLAGKEK